MIEMIYLKEAIRREVDAENEDLHPSIHSGTL